MLIRESVSIETSLALTYVPVVFSIENSFPCVGKARGHVTSSWHASVLISFWKEKAFQVQLTWKPLRVSCFWQSGSSQKRESWVVKTFLAIPFVHAWLSFYTPIGLYITGKQTNKLPLPGSLWLIHVGVSLKIESRCHLLAGFIWSQIWEIIRSRNITKCVNKT